MTKNDHPPWASGPGELLQHGIDLLDDDTDAQRRIAMILIDNAVELVLKTYLTLPKRITGLKLSRKERDDYCASYPNLLDGVESQAGDRLIGFNLGEFEWFHRLRNELYHEGNGLTVDRRNVEVFAELAEKLFEALFDCKLRIHAPKGSDAVLIGEFFEAWISIERNLSQLSTKGQRNSYFKVASHLFSAGEMSGTDYATLHEVRSIRNELIHGEADPEEILRPANMLKIQHLAEVVQAMFDNRIQDSLRAST